MAKRGSNEGSIYKRKSDGLWVGALTLEYDGAKRVRRAFYGKKRADVVAKLREAERKIGAHQPLTNEKLSFEQYVARWLEAVRPSLKPTTADSYAHYLNYHAVPALGRAQLAKIDALQLQKLYADKLAAGLSTTSVRHLHAVIHAALAQAVAWGLVGRNVASSVKAPKMRRHEMQTLTAQQAVAVIEAARHERLGAAVTLALMTGMRRGGPRWKCARPCRQRGTD
jgi:integrase